MIIEGICKRFGEDKVEQIVVHDLDKRILGMTFERDKKNIVSFTLKDKIDFKKLEQIALNETKTLSIIRTDDKYISVYNSVICTKGNEILYILEEDTGDSTIQVLPNNLGEYLGAKIIDDYIQEHYPEIQAQ